MTLAELLDVVYAHHPRALLVDQAGYHDTAEHQRLREAARRGLDGYGTWDAMLDRLRARYSVMDRTLRGRDPAYSAHIEIPGQTLGIHVSLLGPYYAIHRSTGSAAEEAAASDLAREVEAAYPGFSAIPPELGNEIVPDVSTEACLFGEASIYVCLLSDVWRDSSKPWPPPRPTPPSDAERTARRAYLERLWAKYPHTRIVPADEQDEPMRRNPKK